MTVPKHIGVILDGNRRFAKRLMVKPWKGHEWGAKKFQEFLQWCFDIGVEEVTAYAFSIQNFNRPKKEFDYIMDIFAKELTRMLEKEQLDEFSKNGVRLSIIGRLWMLPENVQKLARELMEKTKNNTKKRINMAIAYGGREEILSAVQRIAEEVASGGLKPGEIDEKHFSEHLWLQSEPDMIIRTGGEQRTSNFLPWQGTYSELIFVEKFWPEFEKEDFMKCVADYETRERRFGK